MEDYSRTNLRPLTYATVDRLTIFALGGALDSNGGDVEYKEPPVSFVNYRDHDFPEVFNEAFEFLYERDGAIMDKYDKDDVFNNLYKTTEKAKRYSAVSEYVSKGNHSTDDITSFIASDSNQSKWRVAMALWKTKKATETPRTSLVYSETPVTSTSSSGSSSMSTTISDVTPDPIVAPTAVPAPTPSGVATALGLAMGGGKAPKDPVDRLADAISDEGLRESLRDVMKKRLGLVQASESLVYAGKTLVKTADALKTLEEGEFTLVALAAMRTNNHSTLAEKSKGKAILNEVITKMGFSADNKESDAVRLSKVLRILEPYCSLIARADMEGAVDCGFDDLAGLLPRELRFLTAGGVAAYVVRNAKNDGLVEAVSLCRSMDYAKTGRYDMDPINAMKYISLTRSQSTVPEDLKIAIPDFSMTPGELVVAYCEKRGYSHYLFRPKGYHELRVYAAATLKSGKMSLFLSKEDATSAYEIAEVSAKAKRKAMKTFITSKLENQMSKTGSAGAGFDELAMF